MPNAPARQSEFYERMASDLRARMRELAPAVQEYERLKAILGAVEGGPEPSSVWVDAHGKGPPPSEGIARADGEPRGRRASEVVKLIRSEPGLTRSELAERLGMRVGYLYELLPTLSEKGFVLERDGSWFAA